MNCGARPTETEKEDDKGWWPFAPAPEHDDEATEETKFDKPDERHTKHDEVEEEELSTERNRYVRIILNDAPVPLTGIRGCKKDADGLCHIDAFVSSMHELIGQTDHAKACREDYDFNAEVDDGRPL